LTPTSEEIRISSKLSKTSSSTFDFPATALDNLEKKVVFDFSRPLSKDCFSCSLRLSSFFIGRKYSFEKTHIAIVLYMNDLGSENRLYFLMVNIEDKKATSD